jgi:hypothetical protein
MHVRRVVLLGATARFDRKPLPLAPHGEPRLIVSRGDVEGSPELLALCHSLGAEHGRVQLVAERADGF